MHESNSIYKPINEIKSKLSSESYVLGIFLLGSTLEKEDKIDLFILLQDEKYIDDTIKIITSVSTTQQINPDIWSLEAFKNAGEDNVHAVFKEGKLIYWNAMIDVLASQVFKVRPFTIFTFRLTKFDQKDKVRYNYQLYGKNNNGLLYEWLGQRLSKSCFFVPHANKYKVSRYFNKNNIKYDEKEVFL